MSYCYSSKVVMVIQLTMWMLMQRMSRHPFSVSFLSPYSTWKTLMWCEWILMWMEMFTCEKSLTNLLTGLCSAINIPNGEIDYSASWRSGDGRFIPGTTATYVCNYGYHVNGPNQRTCWSGIWIRSDGGLSRRSFCELSMWILYFLFFFQTT